jgi:hypothetical protein
VTYLKYLLAALAVLLGGAAVVAGEADDSPGLQLIGVLVAAAAIVLVMRSVRRGRT